MTTLSVPHVRLGFLRVGGFFDTLRSGRREEMIREVAATVLEMADVRLADADPFAVHPELNGFALYAADGHSRSASAHETPIQDKKRAVFWMYALNLRTPTVRPLALCSPQLGTKFFLTSTGEGGTLGRWAMMLALSSMIHSMVSPFTNSKDSATAVGKLM